MSSNLKGLLALIVVSTFLISVSDGQFAYPVSPPPSILTTFHCFACEGEDCEVARDEFNETCSGARVACWVTKHMSTGLYTRSCVQPETIRQGVFCNRFNAGREFCYRTITPRGPELICAKCCLNDYCNDDILQGFADPTLPSCISCDGTVDDRCNQEFDVSFRNSTYTEQCLFPVADCLQQSRLVDGRRVYVKGCQLVNCNDETREYNCERDAFGNRVCTQCCDGDMCNRFVNGALTSMKQNGFTVFTGALLQILLFLFITKHF